jgi:cysteine desulfurase
MIYLDHNATTPVLPDVFEAMRPYFCEEWGNPSSTYRFGSRNKSVVEAAREQVASLVGANPREILFTSCATESNNSAINSAIRAAPSKRHIITSKVEHSSVLNYCMALEKCGYKVTYLPVDRQGLLNVADLENAITAETAVVSLMWANNETGVLFPVDEIASVCNSRGVPFHCDAVQSIGKIDVDLRKIAINYLSISGHKFHGPKGVGALFVRRKTPFFPLIQGGHQESGRRGGTENVPLIVGMGTAAEFARQYPPQYAKNILPLRDLLENSILETISNTEINGHQSLRFH